MMNVGLPNSFHIAGFPALHRNDKRSSFVTVISASNIAAVFINTLSKNIVKKGAFGSISLNNLPHF